MCRAFGKAGGAPCRAVAAGSVSAGTSSPRAWLSAGPKGSRALGTQEGFGSGPVPQGPARGCWGQPRGATPGAAMGLEQLCTSRLLAQLRPRPIYFGTASISVAQSNVGRVSRQGAGSPPHPLALVQGWGSAHTRVLQLIFKVASFNSALCVPRLTAGRVIFKLPSAMSRCKDEKTGGWGCWGEPAPQLFNTMPLRTAAAGAPARLLARLQQWLSVPLSALGAGRGSGHFKSG